MYKRARRNLSAVGINDKEKIILGLDSLYRHNYFIKRLTIIL